ELVRQRLRSVRKEFENQLPDNLDVLGSALRTGHSFVGALSVAVDDAGEPSQSEFRRAIADEQLGVPIEEALRVVSIRMDNRDLIQVALVARLQREAGTNAAEVLDQVATNVRNRLEIKRLIRTLTAQGRMARWIVSILPFFLFGAIYVLNRHYLRPLWTHTVGEVAMVVAVIMILTGSYVIKRITEIGVSPPFGRLGSCRRDPPRRGGRGVDRTLCGCPNRPAGGGRTDRFLRVQWNRARRRRRRSGDEVLRGRRDVGWKHRR